MLKDLNYLTQYYNIMLEQYVTEIEQTGVIPDCVMQ